MTNRGFLTWQIQDAIMRMMSSPSAAGKLKWAMVANEARRKREDFDQVAACPAELPSAEKSESPTTHNQ